MCVIIVKPAGVKMPEEYVLKAAYKANPHGCGFVSDNHFVKTMSFNVFMRELSKVETDESCIIHFRLATHGSIKKANCHPFVKDDVFFAHNGILNIAPIGDLTDSETALIKVVHPAIVKYGWGSKEADKIINGLTGGYSKFAIMKDGDLKLYGDFIKQPDGCFYSNLRFRVYLNPYESSCRQRIRNIDYRLAEV